MGQTNHGPLLHLAGVAKSFGDVPALCGVSIAVQPGVVVGLLGPNGAGKTTLVRVVATLLKPDVGQVLVTGVDALVDPAAARAQLGLAGQFASLDPVLAGRENLQLIGRLYGIEVGDCARRTTELLDALGLTGAADRRVDTYSGGCGVGSTSVRR